MSHLVAPSLLAADLSLLHDHLQLVNYSEADLLHYDVMDGCFVPNLTFGLPLLKAVKHLCQKPIDVHLMIQKPEHLIPAFQAAGADIISVHVEACTHLHRVIQRIKEVGALPGVAINPHTPIEMIEHVLEDVHLVCLMSVNPGFGNQKFIYRSLEKIRQLRETITTRNLSTLIEVDGGVALHNAEEILRAGADILVAGSSVFKSEDPALSIQQLKNIEQQRSWV